MCRPPVYRRELSATIGPRHPQLRPVGRTGKRHPIYCPPGYTPGSGSPRRWHHRPGRRRRGPILSIRGRISGSLKSDAKQSRSRVPSPVTSFRKSKMYLASRATLMPADAVVCRPAQRTSCSRSWTPHSIHLWKNASDGLPLRRCQLHEAASGSN